MKGNSRKLMWGLTAFLTLVFILVTYMTHRAVPFMMDDIWYSTMLYDESIPIASLSDIVESQVWHYNNWGGRTMTHSILQLTLLAGEPAADLLNVVFMLLLAGMICLVSEHRSFPAFFAALSMMLGLNANWRMCLFWQSGAANYLYITVFILLFIHCYLRELPEAGESMPRRLPGILLWILPLGILAGWSNENMGPAVWVLSAAVILLVKREGRRIKPWMMVGNLACLAGSILCIAAPGNAVRSGQIAAEQYGTLWKIFLRCYGESKGMLEYLFPAVLILAFLWMLCRCVLKEKTGRRNLLLLLCALLSWGAFVLSPHYPDRASFGTLVLCIFAALAFAKKILRRREDLAWPLWGGAAFVWLRGMYFCGEYLAILWGWIR